MRVLGSTEEGVGASAPLLTARAVGWSIDGQRILEPLDLDLQEGECLAVIGPNGAGKTTLLRLLAGLLEPTDGRLAWRAAAYADLSRREMARRVAYVPQVRPANLPLTVEQMVLLGRYPHLSPWQMSPGAADLERVDHALTTVGLEALRRRPVDTLSGGERQSVFIAAALAQEAEVLLLDEPTTHLDARHQLEVTRLLGSVRRSGRHSIVLTTHELNLAAKLADRVIALRDGLVAATGPPSEVLRPDPLGEIFDAPFSVVTEGDRSHVVLRLER